MKTNPNLSSLRDNLFTRLLMVSVAGTVLSMPHLNAQTAAGGSATTTAGSSSTPPAPVTQRPIMNTSAYNTGAKTLSNQGGTIYNPNEVNPSSPTVAPVGTGTGTPSQSVSAGGGSGSGQSGGSSSPANP